MRTTGTVVRGIRAPILKAGDDLASIATEAVLGACQAEGFSLCDQDVVALTESIVARTQGNYATVEQIAADIRAKFPEGELGITLPILSRNRFSLLLKGISMGVDKLYIQLSYPSDEVGNPLIPLDALDEKGVNPYSDVFTEEEFRRLFGEHIAHPFTGIDYIDLYKSIAPNASLFLANDPRVMLRYTKHVLCCDIHTRKRSVRLLKEAGAQTALCLSDILTKSVAGSGYNPEYGLLGSNLSDERRVKLFPRDSQPLVDEIATRLRARSGKKIEVMIYGDGAFRDPVGMIWELADPVVSPAFTPGLQGTPNELKLKYLADTELATVTGEAAIEAAQEKIRQKGKVHNHMAFQGTTPRRLTDLLGSLCDLTSGSGDKGTPIVLVQHYFDSYAD